MVATPYRLTTLRVLAGGLLLLAAKRVDYFYAKRMLRNLNNFVR